MITLALDTSHKYLAIALIDKDNKLIDGISNYCPKKQSEYILVEIDNLCKKNNIKPFDISAIVITNGPGSYTGVRIAMTVAKVICSLRNIPLYTISSIELLSSNDCLVLMDARGNRAYYGKFINGELIDDIKVDYLENIKNIRDNLPIIGDGSLFNEQDNYPNLCQKFIEHRNKWHLEENVHTVVPVYLKDADSYMVKK